MIKISVNNQYLDLASDFSIRIKRRHPAFVRDSLGKEFSYPINISFSPTNQKILGYVSRQDIFKSTLKIEDVKLTIGSYTSLAVLFIYGVNEEGYDCHIKVNQGALDELLEGKTVSSVLPESIVLGSTTEEVLQYAKDTLEENSNSPLIFLPIRNHLFYQNHDYFGEKFGSRVLLLFPEADQPTNNNKLLYINQVNRLTGEKLTYKFTYNADTSKIKKDNEVIRGHGGIDLSDGDLKPYIINLMDSIRDKSYLKDWNLSDSLDIGLPLDKYVPSLQNYQGIVIECTDQDWVFVNGITVPSTNHPEVFFFDTMSPNQTINHFGYLGKDEFTSDGPKEFSNLLRANYVNGWPFYHIGFNLVPQLKLKSVLKCIFKSISMSVKGVLMDDEELSRLILYSNYALDEIEEVDFNETLHDSLTIASPDVDPLTPGTQVQQSYKSNALLKTLDMSKIGSSTTAINLILQIINKLGLWLDYDEAHSSFIFRSFNQLLDATKLTDWTKREGVSVNKDYSTLEKTASISVEYDDELEDKYLKEIDPSKNIIDLDSLLEYNAWTAVADTYYYIHAENAYYYFDGNQLTFYAYKISTITLEEDGEDISSDIVIPYMHQGDDLTNPAYTYYRIVKYRKPGEENDESWAFNYAMDKEVSRRSWRVPFVPEKGSSPAWSQDEKKSELRLLFYRGMQKDSEGNLYPYASTDVINYDGQVIAKNSLHLHSKYGTYEKHLRRWYRMINEAEVHVFDKQMEIWEALGLKWNQHILINNQKYLMYEYDVVVNMDGIKESQQTMIRL
jgi:hypothetical protein